MHGLVFSSSRITRNLGAYRIAHILREKGWDIEVIDFFDLWSFDELSELVKSRIKSNTKFIGLGALFYQKETLPYWFFDYIKKNYSSISTLYGSQGAIGINYPTIDYALNGWSELAIIELVEYLFSNGKRPLFSLESFGSHTKTINSNQMYPAYPSKSLMVKYEDRDFIEPFETLTIEMSRGCKFKCKFCNFPVLGVKGDYTRNSEDFKNQISDAYDRFGVSSYIVADETFNDSTEKIIKFADSIENLNFSPIFNGFIRADLLIQKKEQLEHLARLGFVGHYYGIESFNHASAKSVGKGMNPEKVKQGLLDIKNYFYNHNLKKYRGTIGLIIGLPYETKDTLNSTMDWLVNNWEDQAINYYALEIPVEDYYIKSELSLDYKNYGYKEYTNLTEEEINILNEYRKPGTLDSVGGGGLIWKNNNMNIVDAIKIHKNFKDIHSSKNFKDDGFYMLSLKNYKFEDQRGEKNPYIESMITEYKNKKMNL